jgi:hypothetical protein
MGYFDFLTSSSFKTTTDGRTLFFPFGAAGPGYEVGPDMDGASLRRQVKAWFIGGLIWGVGAVELLGIPTGLVAASAVVALYYGWAWYLTRAMPLSVERQSLRETFSAQARALNPVLLWASEILMIVLLFFGFAVLATDPDDWPDALYMIVVFGACATGFGYMLVLRQRS